MFPSLYTIAMALVALFEIASIPANTGQDGSFRRVATAPVEGGRLAIYTSDCGAACGPAGTAVRHERPLGGGILLVRRLPGFSSADFERYEIVGPRTVKVFVRGRDGAASRVYEVSPWVYF